jgi:adenylate cyclase
MVAKTEHDRMVEEVWRTYLTTGKYEKERRQRTFFKWLPGDPRCKNCYAPFTGIGSSVVRFLYDKKPSNLNPRLCNVCEVFASKHQGGAEIELSLVFADVRGSTTIAESMNPREFSALINRFYNEVTKVMIDSDALIDKITGDQVAAMFIPGQVGPDHARHALEAAREVLRVTGHHRPEGPWIPLGVGVHTGTAFVGSVGKEGGTFDITVLGDVPNVTARLASTALQGEILVSSDAYQAAGMYEVELESRHLDLKGKSKPVLAYVLTEGRPVRSSIT